MLFRAGITSLPARKAALEGFHLKYSCGVVLHHLTRIIMEKAIIYDIDALLNKERRILKNLLDEKLKDVQSDKDEDQVLTIAAAARFLSKSRQTLENWVSAGYIRKRYIGDSPFFLKSDLLAALKDHPSNSTNK